jgi:hypothetical protein
MRNRRFVGVAVGLVLLGHGGVAVSAQPTQSVSVTGALVQLDVVYETDMDLKLKVEWWGPTGLVGWQAILGPEPGTTGTVKFKITNSQFTSTSAEALQLMLIEGSGYLYLVGIKPYGGTNGGSTTSEGTSLIVQRKIDEEDETKVYHRYFRLEADQGDDVWAKRAIDTSPSDLDPNFRYQEMIVEDGEPGNLGNNEEIVGSALEDFVEDVLALAKNAGLPTPDLPEE